jgi:NAD(P)-dependent dehydrogenase (short-subunit alcohol dehydrogenase family)
MQSQAGRSYHTAHATTSSANHPQQRLGFGRRCGVLGFGGRPPTACAVLERMYTALPVMLLILSAFNTLPRRRTRLSEISMSSATMPVSAGAGGIDNISLDTWRWVLDVNLMGVLHGIRTFLPHIRAHGEGGHIVNTASMAGMNSGLGFSPYSTSKFAVVNMSEGLAMRLKPLGIGVTVLCPGFVRTRISESGRNRPERYGPTQTPDLASPAGVFAAKLAELSVRARPGQSRGASPHRDPRGRTLRLHASRDARRVRRTICRYPGGNAQSGDSLMGEVAVRSAAAHLDRRLFLALTQVDNMSEETISCSGTSPSVCRTWSAPSRSTTLRSLPSD